jgi:molybdopterin molybdotransferase
LTAPMDLEDALARMLADLAAPAATEHVELAAALGRVAARPAFAATAVPPFANSAMDGYAVAAADPAHDAADSFRVVDTIYAGAAPTRAIGRGECARIFTGAPMPDGADTVVAQEDATTSGEGVRFTERPERGRFVRAAGGDVAAGEELLAAGTRLHGGHLALLAAAGVPALHVFPTTRLAIVISGDELRSPGARLEPGQIHDSARFALPAVAAPLPVEVVSVRHAGDSPQALAQAFELASEEADAIVSTGGVSVGDADHVREVLAAGGSIGFWRLALKPGRPFAYGRYRGLPFFGLPGNPVSSLVTFLLLVRPALLTLAGVHDVSLPRRRVRLARDLHKAPGRRDFQRARIEHDGSATAFERQDSNVLSVLAQADLLLDLPEEAGDLSAGTEVDAIDLAGLLGSR